MMLTALFLAAVSYSRDIAPIFALHCNSCHGDSGTAGGLVTRTLADLMKAGSAIVPGDPDRSPIVQFIEGHRGEEHRMPLGAPPLAAEQIALIRRWIAAGAPADADSTIKYKLAVPKARIRRSEPLQIECSVPARAYLILSIRDSRRILFERRTAIRSPGEPVSWSVWPERGWPRTVTVEVDILYAESEPKRASLRVGRTTFRF